LTEFQTVPSRVAQAAGGARHRAGLPQSIDSYFPVDIYFILAYFYAVIQG